MASAFHPWQELWQRQGEWESSPPPRSDSGDPDFYKNSQEANLKAMETELKKAREIAPDGILGFNIMVATKNYVEYVKTAVKIGADIIISGAGLPVNLPEYVKGTATKIAPIVSTVKSAKVICKLWDRNYKTAPDLVVVEGPLAGGHLGFSREQLTELGADTDQVSKTYHKAEYEEEVKGIIALVKEYGEKYGKEIPVVTAGGVYTHEDMRHCIEDLGAGRSPGRNQICDHRGVRRAVSL